MSNMVPWSMETKIVDWRDSQNTFAWAYEEYIKNTVWFYI